MKFCKIASRRGVQDDSGISKGLLRQKGLISNYQRVFNSFVVTVVNSFEFHNFIKSKLDYVFSLLKGVKAAIMPTELTVGLGGKGHLSGRLSEDLDNTDTPWVVSVLFLRVGY